MSFVAPSQRSFDPVPHQPAISQLASRSSALSRMPPLLSSFDPNLPLNPHSTVQNGSQSLDHHNEARSKVGQTRCYWALLSSELKYLYLDPVFQIHLQAQAEVLVGRSLLEFVHPDERASAKQDLGNVLESRTLHGSVTRVRYSRLSSIRRELGYQGPLPDSSDTDKITVDGNYMAVDIVINWAAEGLVLCFLHAVVDIDPAKDNNEEHKTVWTNWCGTPDMTSQQAQLLYRCLTDNISVPGDMGRIFQILLNRPDRPLWMSWPPDSPQPAQGRPTSRDFAKLAEEVQIGSNVTGSDAKTSCTRRYKALQTVYMGPEGNREVESIFIPHGSIIFACHKVDLSPYIRSARNGNNISYTNSNYVPQSQSFYAASSHAHTYDLPPLAPGNGYNNYLQSTASQGVVNHYTPHEQWPHGSVNAQGHYGMYMSSQNHQHQWPSHPPSYNLDPSQAGQQRPMSPYMQTTGDATTSEGDSASGEVPPPRSSQRRGAARDQYGTGGRSTGKPPVGISRCSSCKVTQSPEWRKGPSGKKDLCNACGLRYARSRAKKEGVTSSRRRKEKFSLNTKQDVHQQSVQGSYSTPGARRATFNNEDSFLGPNNSESYSSHSLRTPSPSPSLRTGMNFVHYSHQNQPQDQHSPGNRSSHFNYPIPSPMLDPTSAHHHTSPRDNAPSLPRLTPVSYPANRGPPSTSTSPMSAGLPTHASSFERDSSVLTSKSKDRVKRERDHAHSPINLPPTPMSASSDWSRKSNSFLS